MREHLEKTQKDLSSMNLLVYLIHDNVIVSDYGRYDLFLWLEEQFGRSNLFVEILIFALVSIVCSFLASIIYRLTIQHNIHLICEKIGDATMDWVDNRIEIIMRRR